MIEELVSRPDEEIRHAAEETLHCRNANLKPETCDENTRSVEAVLATEAPCTSVDSRTGKGVFEVWRMDGAEYGDWQPLMDNHRRDSSRNVLGSITDVRRDDSGQMIGRLAISEAEENIWTKVRERHIRCVSAGIAPLEFESVKAGETRSIRGQIHSAPKDREMRVVTRWRLREVSLTPVGADSAAKIRTEEGLQTMQEHVRKFLEGIGLPATASAEDAKKFYDSLPDVTRAIADDFQGEAVPAGESEGAEATRGEEVGVERAAKKIAKAVKKAAKTAADSDTDADKLRAEGAKLERERVAELQRLGSGLSDEIVRKAIDEVWTIEAAKDRFLEAHRTRTDAATPAIHSRSHDNDCTAAALGVGLALRFCEGERLLELNAHYVRNGDGDYTLRRHGNSESARQNYERLLNQGDEYSSMSLVDICREACRLDGKPQNLRTRPEEVFRTAASGSALSNIFTTNVNAQLLIGYMDFTDSTTGWCSEAEVNNFLTQERDMMGKFGTLKRLAKGRPAEHLDTSDWKESYKIDRYAGQFVVDEQDIINDRFGAIEQTSPMDMGLAAAQVRPNMVYYLILSNPNLDFDGGQLFQTSASLRGANKGTGTALSATSIQSGLAVLSKQRQAGRVLNIRGRYLIVPQDLKWTADISLLSNERIISASSGGTYNPLKDLGIEARFDDRMGVAGVVDPKTGTAQAGTATNFLITARPGEEGAKTIEVGYRRGTGRAPVVRSFILDRGQWGMGWDVNLDIGAKPLDFRGMYFDPGA